MIRLYLMGEKGFQVLANIIENKLLFSIKDVVYSCDKNILNDYTNEIVELCQNNSLTVYERGNCPEHQGWSIAVAWRWIIAQQDRLIVFHDSILPRYRGFSPLVTALKNGECELGVTAIFANEKYDQGEIISQVTTNIDYPVKIKDAISQISPLYFELAETVIRKIASEEEIMSLQQDNSKATYSLWLDYDDYFVDWNLSSDQIERHVNATGEPYLGAKTSVNDDVFTLNSGMAVTDVVIENRVPGKVIFVEDDHPVVVCGSGLYKITDMTNTDGNSVLPLKRFRSRFD